MSDKITLAEKALPIMRRYDQEGGDDPLNEGMALLDGVDQDEDARLRDEDPTNDSIPFTDGSRLVWSGGEWVAQ